MREGSAGNKQRGAGTAREGSTWITSMGGGVLRGKVEVRAGNNYPVGLLRGNLPLRTSPNDRFPRRKE